jgi:hypothetical protein
MQAAGAPSLVLQGRGMSITAGNRSHADGIHHHINCLYAGTGAGGPLGVAALGTHALLGSCMAVATSGIPPKHALWRTNVCSPHFGLSRALDGSKVEDEEQSPPEVGAVDRCCCC